MSDNDFTSRLGFEVDQASIERAKAALTSVTKAVEKAADDVIRANDLDRIAKEYAKLAVEGKGAINVADDLARELALIGATEREIEKTVRAFDRQVDAIKRADLAAERKADNDRERAAEESSRLGRFERVEETSGKIGDVGDAAAALGSATGIQALGDFGAIFEGIEALARLKEGLLALPESFTATAQAVGLLNSAQSAAIASDTASAAASSSAAAAETAQATASGTLAASSGAATVGISGMVLALGPIAAVLAGITIAAKIMADSLAGANEDLKAAYDAQRQIQEFVRSGATSEEAQARLDEVQAVLDDERANLAAAKADYAEAFNAAANSIPIVGDLFARIADLFGAFSATKGEIDEATKAVQENEKEQGALNKALGDGKFAANDAKKAQEEAAKATTKTADAVEKAARKEVDVETSAFQQQESLLAQHLANESTLKADAYTQQIAMVAQAAAAVSANGTRALNTSGYSNAFGGATGGSFGGLRPISTSTTNRSVGTLTINTSANPQDVVKVLGQVGLI